MTSFKKYFIYHFKTTFLRLVIIAVLSALLVATSVWRPNIFGMRMQIQLGILAFIAATVSTIIPIIELLPFKNRRNIDTVLCLPIDSRKIAAVHFINGFVHVILINLACFISTFFVLVYHSYSFKILNLIALFAFTIFASIIVYSATAFIFDRANTAPDGIIWLIMYSFIGCLTFLAVRALYGNIIGKFNLYSEETDFFVAACLSPYYIFLSAWSRLNTQLIPPYQNQNVTYPPTPLYNHNITGIILWSVITLLCIFGFIYLFKNKRPEDIGSTSSSAWGYKVLLPWLPIVTLSNTTNLLSNNYVTSVITTIIYMVIGYTIYRRSIKFKRCDYITIAVSVIVAIALLYVTSLIGYFTA